MASMQPPTMKASSQPGIWQDHKKLFTRTYPTAQGQQVYNEHFRTQKGKEYRSWNPYRSKLAAALLKNIPPFNLTPTSHILYLGAATGTTVSHLSDIASDGMIYAVECAPMAMTKFLQVTKTRSNIIPLHQDASHPDRYRAFVPQVDLIYQDIAQRQQADIFMNNFNTFAKPETQGILMVKARSIDVSLSPQQAYNQVEHTLIENGFTVNAVKILTPYDKDHAVFLVQKKT